MVKLFRIEYDANGRPVKEFLEVFDDKHRDDKAFRDSVKENHGNGSYQLVKNIKNKKSGNGQIQYLPVFLIKNGPEKKPMREISGRVIDNGKFLQTKNNGDEEMDPQMLELIIKTSLRLESIERKVDEILKIANSEDAAALPGSNPNQLLGAVASGDLGSILGMLGVDPQLAATIQLMHSKSQQTGNGASGGIDLTKFAQKQEEVKTGA